MYCIVIRFRNRSYPSYIISNAQFQKYATQFLYYTLDLHIVEIQKILIKFKFTSTHISFIIFHFWHINFLFLFFFFFTTQYVLPYYNHAVAN